MADPVRLERDGAIASLVLSDPPLNLFGEATFRSLATCMDEVEAAQYAGEVTSREEAVSHAREVFARGTAGEPGG